MASLESRLSRLLRENPTFQRENHFLKPHVEEALEACRTRSENAEMLVDRIEAESSEEQKTLAAAFNRIDQKRRGALSFAEVKLMNAYLGFPAGDEDVKQVMALMDADGSGSVTFNEFEQYVGKMGGSIALFAERRKRLSQRGSDIFQLDDMQASLNEAGIGADAQASWRLVVGESDFRAVAELRQCQKTAVATIRRLAKSHHEAALVKLQQRVARLGYADTDLWMTLAWIRELAPVIVHVNLDKMIQFMENDTHYRNQFETQSSGGLLNTKVREKWEKDLFAGSYDRAEGRLRPKYGVQNVMNDYRGVVKCAQYGDSYLILKDVRLRCTFAPEDSANLKADKLAVLDYYGHVLYEYSDDELKETLKIGTSAESAVLGDSDRVGKMKYKEAQIHGDVAFAQHVERLVAHTKHRATMGDRIKAVARKHGWQMSWMDEEQRRMRSEDMHKLGGEAWKERLSKMQADGARAADVPEGYCIKGCGRPVAPGVTRAGNPFKTCCRGCVMGFGHDLTCGNIDPSKVGEGLCSKGCGRAVAEGADGKGRAFTTCCRGCALGMDHSKTCREGAARPPLRGSSSPSLKSGRWLCPACSTPNNDDRNECQNCGAKRTGEEPALCKEGCGRSVAPGATKSGRKFDTCCRACAMKTGHNPECNERAAAEGTG